MVLALGFISILGGSACSVCSVCVYYSVWCFSVASLGSSDGHRLLCILCVRLRMSSWLCLAQHSVCCRSFAFQYFPSLLSLFRGVGASPQQFFSIELTVQCDGCLIWGLGWRAGLIAGLWVGQAYGVFHRPGFGLLVSVPRSLSTQPPFATQALIKIK